MEVGMLRTSDENYYVQKSNQTTAPFFFFNIFPTPLWVSSPFLPNVGLYSVRVTASPIWWAYSHSRPCDPLQTVKG